jgi:hypothetical protein
MMISPGTPIAGYYAMRLAKGGIKVAVRVWFGPPTIDGETQDRSPRWCCSVDGITDKLVDGVRVPLDPIDDEVWPFCALHPIDQTEFLFLLKRTTWARTESPDHPAANPRKPIDLRKLKPAW